MNKRISDLEEENRLLREKMEKLNNRIPEVVSEDQVKDSNTLGELHNDIDSNEKNAEKEIKGMEDDASTKIAESEKPSKREISDERIEEMSKILNMSVEAIKNILNVKESVTKEKEKKNNIKK